MLMYQPGFLYMMDLEQKVLVHWAEFGVYQQVRPHNAMPFYINCKRNGLLSMTYDKKGNDKGKKNESNN